MICSSDRLSVDPQYMQRFTGSYFSAVHGAKSTGIVGFSFMTRSASCDRVKADPDPRHHRRAAAAAQHQRFDRRLPFRQVGFRFRQLHDVVGSVPKRDELSPVWQRYRILELALPTHALTGRRLFHRYRERLSFVDDMHGKHLERFVAAYLESSVRNVAHVNHRCARWEWALFAVR